MTAASLTPADLTITPRDRRFAKGGSTPRHWLRGDPVGSALYDAMSATFPLGEAFFVESVRACRADAPAKLAEEIKAFTTQEAIHSREHAAFNRRAADAGYDLQPLEDQVAKRLDFIRSRPPIAALAATMALEHFTAILAHELLADPRHLKGSDAATADLWRWHATEEIEHKGVAYDTWMHATRDWPRFKRWKVKAKVMLFATRNFVLDRTRGTMDLLEQDGMGRTEAFWKTVWYAWIHPGMFRRIGRAWAAYFLPGFHPWNEDDRHLIAAYEATAPVNEPDAVARKVRRAA